MFVCMCVCIYMYVLFLFFIILNIKCAQGKVDKPFEKPINGTIKINVGYPIRICLECKILCLY